MGHVGAELKASAADDLHAIVRMLFAQVIGGARNKLRGLPRVEDESVRPGPEPSAVLSFWQDVFRPNNANTHPIWVELATAANSAHYETIRNAIRWFIIA